MAWANGPLILYHGTDNRSVLAGGHTEARGAPGTLDLSMNPCNIYIGPILDAPVPPSVRSGTDFGPGFYTTTSEHQARQWANERVRKAMAPGRAQEIAVVLRFEVARDSFHALEILSFLRDDPAFWDFITYCRQYGRQDHLRSHNGSLVPWPEMYEVVHGPVTLWQQTLVLKDCDQYSFHSHRAIAALGQAYWHDHGSPFFPPF
jgi:hypothetical protein